MGFGISLGLLYRNPIMLATIQISFIIDNFKFRVAAEAGTFEAESCLSSTLNNLNSLEVDINTQVVRNYSARVRGDSGTVEGFESVVSGIKSLRDSDLINTTTLALFPSGVKAGKTYSLLPENPNGDFTIVRNTTATRINSAGFIEEVAANTPRLNYLTVGGNPFLLDETQSTNLAINSSNLRTSSWLKAQGGVTVVLSSVLSPNQVDFAEILNVNGTNGGIWTRQKTYNSTQLQTSNSVFIKKLNTRYFAIRNAGSGGLHDVFDFDTETFTNISANTLSFESFPNGWYRIKSTKTSSTANEFFSCFPAIDNSGVENISTARNVGVYIWGAQAEINSVVSSHIPTLVSAVTRNADVITVTPPTETLKITTTFSDNTTQVLTTIPAVYTAPEGVIKSIIMSKAVVNMASQNSFTLLSQNGDNLIFQ